MKNGSRPYDACGAHSVVSGRALSPDKSSRRKRIHKAAQAALLALSFLATSTAYAANDWVNFATVSMTNATTPKLTNGYGCYTDGKDVLCDSKTSAITFGTGGLIDMGGLTVAGSVSAAAVSATYISGTVIQVNTSSMPCSLGLAGTIRYNSGNIEYCNGSVWGQLANGSGGTLSGGSATAIAFWNGTNSLTYESATTSGLYWDHINSRLGVGTNAPTAALQVQSAVSGTAGLSVRGGGNGSFNAAYMQMEDSSSGKIWQLSNRGSLDGYTQNRFVLWYYDGSSWQPMFSMLPNGNTGIGTGYITPTATLQVSGTFTVSNSAQTTTPSLLVASGGNVGMGLSSPAYRLEVKQTTGGILPGINIVTDTAGPRASMGFGLDAGTTTGWIIGQSKDQVQKDFYVYDVAKGVFRMVFDTSGSIGIGTANPGSSLTVVGGEIQTGTSGGACVTATNGGAIRYSAGTLYYCNGSNTWTTLSGGGAGFTGAGSATAIAFWNGTNSLTYESATTSGLYWDHTNGRLGIGTNVPGFPLTVSGGAIMSVNSTADRAIYMSGNGGSGTPLLQGTNGNNTVVQSIAIQPWGGNVGVGGFGSPTATLQVSGSLLVSTTGQNTLSSASLYVDTRGVSVSSIVHINGSAISPIGAGGNAILSGTTAVSTSSAGSITLYAGGSPVMVMDGSGAVGIGTTAPGNSSKLVVNGGNIRLTGSNAPSVYISATSGDVYAFGANTVIPGAGIWDNTTGVWPISIKDTTGYVGVNTTAQTYRLSVSGDSSAGFKKAAISVEDTGASGRVYSLGSRGATGFVLGDDTAGVARMIIAPNGVFTLTGTSTCTLANGTGTTSCTSDRRLKERIEPIKDPLDKLMLINGVTYHWKRKDISGPEHIGVIAQDVEKAFPQAVTEVSDSTIGSAKTVDYSILVAPIIEVIKDFKHRFDTDHDEIEKLKATNDNLEKSLNAASDNTNRLLDEVENLKLRVRVLEHRNER